MRADRHAVGEIDAVPIEQADGAAMPPPAHSAFCLCPHSLHAYSTRACPLGALMRLSAPHFPQWVSIRVSPRFTVTDFRSSASLMRRSVSSRIACFDIRVLFACHHSCGGTFYQSRVFSAPSLELVGRLSAASSAI